MVDSIFTWAGDSWLPGSSARGPWGDTLHGGAPAALLMHHLDQDVPTGLTLARLTVDLCRPVPPAPLTVRVQPLRSGRRVLLREALLYHQDRLLARATALHADQDDGVQPLDLPICPLPNPAGLPETTLAGAAAAAAGVTPSGPDGLHQRLLVRRTRGNHGGGQGEAWLHMPLLLAPDLPLGPASHLACLSDFANGLAQRRLAAADGRVLGFINADINLHVLRLPEPGWVAMSAGNELGAGRGLVTAQCWDAAGLVARISQAVLPVPSNIG